MGDFASRLAVRVLARDGLAAIWNLHYAATRAHLEGHRWAADTLIAIADAAEEIWHRRAIDELSSIEQSQ